MTSAACKSASDGSLETAVQLTKVNGGPAEEERRLDASPYGGLLVWPAQGRVACRPQPRVNLALVLRLDRISNDSGNCQTECGAKTHESDEYS